MNFKEHESDEKLRGGYYTPNPIAQFLSKWILHKKPRTLLEPSCGNGAFIHSLHKLHRHKIHFTGVEIIKSEANKAKQVSMNNKLLESKIIHTDFLDWAHVQLKMGTKFDAVLGNPPYIRYQYLEKTDQELASLIFARYQLPFTKHTNAWVPFIIASIGLLTAGGRLAMVIPSEILHVLHADSLRKFLLAECKRILLIDPKELLFEQALQGTVLLMIEKKDRPEQHCEGVAILSTIDNKFLLEEPEYIFQNATYISGDILNGKWMKILLAPTEIEVFEEVRKLKLIKRFSEIASVDVGIVTGANKFFLVDDETISKYGLEEFAHPMFGRSEHCRGLIYNNKVHENNQERGLPTNFVVFGKVPYNKLPKGAQEYIRLGETQNLHTRYKCRIRSPWYAVPSVYSTEVGMLKRSHNYPRLILNDAGAFTTDTAYRIRSTLVSPKNLVFSFINSLTALTAELEGRHYGGGVLELVPSEIEKLLIPLTNDINIKLDELNKKILSKPNIDTLLSAQDDIVLKACGIGKKERQVLHEAWQRIRIRRHRIIGESLDINEHE